MSAEECKHLLNPDWCAECNGKAAQEKADEIAEETRILALPRWFRAQYIGECGVCGRWFTAGTPVVPREDWFPGDKRAKYKAACCAPAGEPA